MAKVDLDLEPKALFKEGSDRSIEAIYYQADWDVCGDESETLALKHPKVANFANHTKKILDKDKCHNTSHTLEENSPVRYLTSHHNP